MEVTEYFATRPEADIYASGLSGFRLRTVRVGHCKTPVRGYYVVAVYHYYPTKEG